MTVEKKNKNLKKNKKKILNLNGNEKPDNSNSTKKTNISYTEKELNDLAKSQNTTKKRFLKNLVKSLRDKSRVFMLALIFCILTATAALCYWESLFSFIESVGDIIFNKNNVKGTIINNYPLDSKDDSDFSFDSSFETSDFQSDNNTENDNKEKPKFKLKGDDTIRRSWWDSALKTNPLNTEPELPELTEQRQNVLVSPDSPLEGTIKTSPQSTPGSPAAVSPEFELNQQENQTTGPEASKDPEPELSEFDADALWAEIASRSPGE